MGQKRGWIIIGIDLLIVLGVYFLYSSFAFEARLNTLKIKEELRYELSVSSPTSDTIPVKLTVSNPGASTRTAKLPQGLVIFLTTGRRTENRDKFWATKPLEAGSITLSAGESRSWSLAPARPRNYSGPLYVALFIDENRQGKVEVPE